MNLSALFANLKANPLPAIGGLLAALAGALMWLGTSIDATGVTHIDPLIAKWAGIAASIGGMFQMFGKQSTTTGGTSPNATVVPETLPQSMTTKATNLADPAPKS